MLNQRWNPFVTTKYAYIEVGKAFAKVTDDTKADEIAFSSARLKEMKANQGILVKFIYPADKIWTTQFRSRPQ